MHTETKKYEFRFVRVRNAEGERCEPPRTVKAATREEAMNILAQELGLSVKEFDELYMFESKL